MASEKRDEAADLSAQDRVARLLADLEDGEESANHGVLGRLFRQGYMFEFFQAVRLLEELFPQAPGPGEGFALAQERIRFKPHEGLGFPAADVKKVELVDDGEKPPYSQVVATFMGLYGIDSPMPSHFSNLLVADDEENWALRDFLDIFNHRLYSLFYRSWKKYRPALHFKAPGTDAFSHRLLCLAGVDPATADSWPVAPLRLVPLAARLTCPVRSVEGLGRLLTTFFSDVAVRVVENVARWAAISQPPRLGRGPINQRLGETAIIGRRLVDRTGKFRLVLGPLGFERYLTLLPGGETAALLHGLVQFYIPDFLAYDVELLLQTEDIPPIKLGSEKIRLGRHTWLGKPGREVQAQVVNYQSRR